MSDSHGPKVYVAPDDWFERKGAPERTLVGLGDGMSPDDIRHVYVHPEHADFIREEMRAYGVDRHAELHIDHECPPGKVYWCAEPL